MASQIKIWNSSVYQNAIINYLSILGGKRRAEVMSALYSDVTVDQDWRYFWIVWATVKRMQRTLYRKVAMRHSCFFSWSRGCNIHGQTCYWGLEKCDWMTQGNECDWVSSRSGLIGCQSHFREGCVLVPILLLWSQCLWFATTNSNIGTSCGWPLIFSPCI